MRILLATAVAIAPLMTASGALAEVVVSTARTTAIQTSNATGSGADAIRIASGGTVTVASGAAVTVDSNHSATVDAGGAVTMDNSSDGATGLLVTPGRTANVSNAGSITVSDSLTSYPDTDGDGDVDGPWATGTGRYGIRLAAGGATTGDVKIASGGLVAVEGNNSYAIAIEGDLVGKFESLGTIRATGSNSYGVRTTGNITGPMTVIGSVQTRGENAVGVGVEGDVSGRLTVQGEVFNTGYRYTEIGIASFEAGLDADDKLQSGSAVVVAGNVGGGVVFDIAPSDEDDDVADEDGDGIADTSERNATISVYGRAPAVSIGSATRAITLGAAGTGDNAYGLINRGSVTAVGHYEGIAANGVAIGGQGQTVTIAGGIRNEGTISTTGTNAASTAVRLGAGATTPTLVNTGTIVAAATGAGAPSVTAVDINAGASLTTLENRGAITGRAQGGTANIAVIRDTSGTLTTINNTGGITALQESTTVTGRTVALDLAANTSGVTIVQSGVPSEVTGLTPDTDGDGVPDAFEPQIIGDVKLGTGADTMDIRNGLVIGAIDFGAGADTLKISGGATVASAVTDSDGALAIDIGKGSLELLNRTALNASSLNVAADGKLVVTLDPATSSAGVLNVSGTANIANGAGLGVRFNSLITGGPQRFNVIDAGTLNVGTFDQAAVQANSPYMYVVQAGTDQPNGIIYADVRRRTADEAGLIPVEAQMYDAFYGSLVNGKDVANAFLSQRSREEFINLYEQLLPDHSGGPLLSLSSGVDAVTRALVGRNASAAPGTTSAWVQEINFYADKDKTDSYGFRSEGFGVAGGIERGGPLGAVGVSAAFTSSDLEDPESEAEEVLSANLLEIGLYWRAQGARWTSWARAAGGYATFESERRLIGSGLNLSNSSSWSGYSAMAAGGVSYEESFGRLTVRPEAYLEYFYLSEGGHSEEGGGDGFDLDIDSRSGHLFAATAAVNLGWSMGDDSWVKPELRLGWRQNISVDPGETIARFRSGGGDFRLTPGTIEGGGPIVGLRVNVGNALGMLSVSADAEMIEDYVRYMLFIRASFRF